MQSPNPPTLFSPATPKQIAFTSILRRSASSLAPLATQFARGHLSYHGAVVTALSHVSHSQKPTMTHLVPIPRHNFKQISDEWLLRIIKWEIKRARELNDLEKVERVPSNFPFKVEDTSGTQTVTLKRTYEDEDIKVEVHMPDLVIGEEEDYRDDKYENENADILSSMLVVTVSKKDGPSLEFSVTAFPDEIQIDSLKMKSPDASEDQITFEGPDFHDLDANLQEAFHKYLEIRGLKPSTTKFLREYMLNKEGKEYANWLQKLKQYVEA